MELTLQSLKTALETLRSLERNARARGDLKSAESHRELAERYEAAIAQIENQEVELGPPNDQDDLDAE